MKISNQQISEALKAYLRDVQEPEGPKGNKKSENRLQQDRVELSVDRAELERLLAKAKEIPEVRTERVQELRKMVQEGNYRVDSRKIAEKLMGRNIVDRLK